MIKDYDESVKINHNPNWSYIPDHSYRILIISVSESDKTNELLNLKKINEQMMTKFIWT